MSSAITTPNADRSDEWFLLVLSAASGATDAFAFLCLGKVFAGVMTGNLVLVGASVGAGDRGAVPRAVVALAGYAFGAAGAALATARLAPRPLLALAAAGWGLGAGRSLGPQLVLLFAAALAMGVQARAWGTPTTYFTGTFTNLAGRLAKREAMHADRWVAGRLVAVVAGAALTSLVVWCCSPAAGVTGVALCAAAFALPVRG